MPIILDNLSANAVVTNYTPKFFSKDVFTGRGRGSSGLLNETFTPANVKQGEQTTVSLIAWHNTSMENNGITTKIIPVCVFRHSLMNHLTRLPVPNTQNLVELGSLDGYTLYAELRPHSVMQEKYSTSTQTNGVISKRTIVSYKAILWCLNDQKKDDPVLFYINRDSMNVVLTESNIPNYSTVTRFQTHVYHNDASCALCVVTADPHGWVECVKYLVSNLKRHNKTGPAHAVQNKNLSALDDYLLQYNLYDALSEQARLWQTEIDKYIRFAIVDDQTASPQSKNPNQGIVDMLSHLSEYAVPLDMYQPIYKDLTKYYSSDTVSALVRCSLNLMMHRNLEVLNAAKPALAKTPKCKNFKPSGFQPNHEQMAAITTTEPLVIVQAGAGTGKSSTIVQRINYLLQAGVDPSTITALSFTNAAANHLNDLIPSIQSMTIASMVHSIYELNFPNHILSSEDTLANTLDIFYPFPQTTTQGKLAKKIADLCREIRSNQAGDDFIHLNNLVEDNYNEIIEILNTIGQTTLPLEIMLCYQNLDNLQEPNNLDTKFLITDEVQDNSIFEFIFSLKYCLKHKAALFIVGDCSQTLFEFRASRPDALNALESSGVFQCYKLEVNYRSNQEILDYANTVLSEIEANRFANIQLRANSLRVPDKDSFQDKIKIELTCVPPGNNGADKYTREFLGVYLGKIKPWIDAKLAKGEKVAFISWKRIQAYKAKEWFEEQYGADKVASLLSEQSYTSNIFTKFIKRYWNEVRFAPSDRICSEIHNSIYAHRADLIPRSERAQNRITDYVVGWRKENEDSIRFWANELKKGNLSLDDFLGAVMANMIEYEIKTNNTKANLIKQKNALRKTEDAQKNAQLLFGTIHSAKGLEFDNVIVLIFDESNMSEDKKRMYYVALTRAKIAEYILVFKTGFNSHSVFKDHYDNLIKELPDTVTSYPATRVAGPIGPAGEMTEQ